MSFRRLLVLMFSILLFASPLVSQSFRGAIQGTVTDSTGAAIAAAEVKILHIETGLTRTLQTNAQGDYTTSQLPLGTYSITVTKQGFQTQTVKGVSVSVGAATDVDIKLSPGEVKQAVEVNAEVPLVETTADTMGGTIAGEQAAELPINGRDFTKLLVLVPGATGDPVGSTDSPGSYGEFSINGNRGRSNNYMLDGTDMNDGYRNLPSINQAGVYGTPGTLLPVDALAEVPVMSGADAEFGRNSGAVVNLVTKSGTNRLHGSGYGFFRNDALGARNYFNTTDQSKYPFNNKQFGGSIGGALVQNKSFWFFAYEGQREDGKLPQQGTVPTLADIAANTPSGGINPVTRKLPQPGIVPTRANIADDAPASGINPVIAKLLATNPWGLQLPATGDGHVTFPTAFNNHIDSLIAKIDQHLHLLSDADLLTGRYFFGNANQSFPLALTSGGGLNTYSPIRVNILSLSYTSVPKSNIIVELRGGFNRYHEDFLAQDHGLNPCSTLGLCTAGPNSTANDTGLPLISISGYSSIGATNSDPRGRVDDNYQLFGNVSHTHGNHAFKYGYEFRRTFIKSFFDAGYRGKLSFADLSSFLAGTPDGGFSAGGGSVRHTFQNNSGLYFQDSWRVTNRLTLNYGIRWDYYGVLGETANQFSLLNQTTGQLQQVGANGGPGQLYPKDWKNFGPRLSAAYDLTGNGKLVVRAGYGLFYDAYSQDFFIGQIPYNFAPPGVAYAATLSSSSPVGTIVANQPVFPSDSYSSSTYGLFTVDPKLTTPYISNYNLNFEGQLSSGIALQIGYVGSAGRHLFRFRDINQPKTLGDYTSCPFYATQGCININQIETTSNSSYNSLQTSLKMKNWHGVSSTLNYTWSHSIDNASDGADYVPNAAQPDNSYNPRAERASSNFDSRHRIQWYWSYEFPKPSSAKLLTNGWAIDGVVVHSTGQPFNVSYLFEDDYNGANQFFGRPDLVGNPFAGTHGPSAFLNLAAFAVPCTWDSEAGACNGGYHFGNLPRNAFRGPDYTNFDFSLTKNTKIGERATLQIRADFFNILNHPNFSNPLMPNFGVDFLGGGSPATNGTRGTGAGMLAITATPDVATGNPFLGGGGPRNIQLGAKISF